MNTHLRLLRESYLINTNMTGYDGFQKYVCPCAMDKVQFLSIGMVNITICQPFKPLIVIASQRAWRIFDISFILNHTT